jgi:hypothetical protein
LVLVLSRVPDFGGGSQIVSLCPYGPERRAMVQPLSQQALSELIGSIYDCALDPTGGSGHWPK